MQPRGNTCTFSAHGFRLRLLRVTFLVVFGDSVEFSVYDGRCLVRRLFCVDDILLAVGLFWSRVTEWAVIEAGGGSAASRCARLAALDL